MVWRGDVFPTEYSEFISRRIRAARSLFRAIDGVRGAYLPLWASFAVVASFVKRYLVSPTPDMAEFHARAVGPAVLAGLDPSRRASLLFLMLVKALLAVPACYGLYAALEAWARRRLSPTAWLAALRPLQTTVFLLAAATLIRALLKQPNARDATHVIGCIVAAQFIWLLLAMGASRSRWQRLPLLLAPGWQAAGMIGALALWNALAQAFGAEWAASNRVGVTWAVFLVLWTALGLLLGRRWPAVRWAQLARYLAVPAGCAALTLLGPFVASEIQHAGWEPWGLGASQLVWIFDGTLLLAACAWLLGSVRQGRHHSRATLANFTFPALAVMAGVCRGHHDSAPIGGYDFLHLGNLVVPAQQLVEFGKLPFVDNWYARGLVDFLGQTLYDLLHGWTNQGLDAYAWAHLAPDICTALMTYGVVAAVFSPLAGLLVAITVGLEWAISSYYVVCILPALFLPGLLRCPSVGRWSAFWLAALFTFAWMPSAASAALPASIGVVVVAMVAERRHRSILGIYTFVAVVGSCAAAYFAVLAWRGHSIGDTLHLISAFVYTDTLIGPYPMLTANYGPMSIVQYVALPCATLLCACVIALRAVRARKLENSQAVILFVALVGVGLLQRALRRHCLFEGPQFTYLAAATACLPWVLVSHRVRGAVGAVFVAMGLMSLQPSANSASPTPKSYYKEMHRWEPNQPRVTVGEDSYDPARVAELKRFLDVTMEHRQTFVELVNAHLLYALTERPYAFFHHSSQVLQSDGPQEVYVKQWASRLPDFEIPYVIAKDAYWWGSAIDGIPPSIGTYRISEFVYAHYEPYITVGGFDIWKQKGFAPLAPVALVGQVGYEFELPLTRIKVNDATFAAEPNTWPVTAGTVDPFVWDFVDMHPIAQRTPVQRYEVLIKYVSNQWGVAGLGLSAQDTERFDGVSVPFSIIGDGKEHWSEPLTHPWFRGPRVKGLRLDPPDGSVFAVTGVKIRVVTDESPHPIEHIDEDVSVHELPRLWAANDPLHAIDRTAVLEELVNAPKLWPTDGLKVNVNPTLEKEHGNYVHLRINSRHSGIVRVAATSSRATGTMRFDVKGSAAPTDYLVRISSLYAWNDASQLALHSEGFDAPPTLERLNIREGD